MAYFLKSLMRAGVIAGFLLVSGSLLPRLSVARDCVDCAAKCCAREFGIKVCVPGCETTCALANVGCGGGQIQIPVPGPIDVPPVQVQLPPINRDVAAALLTGGMVNPVTRKAADDAIWNLTKAVRDIEKNAKKAVNDTSNEAGRVQRQIADAGEAIKGYVEAQTNGTIKSYEKALNRIREGKAIDAMWHLGTDPIQTTNEAAAQAAMESDLISTVGQVTASVYGGPGGSAAYAAWLAYHQTGGDVNLALRVGIITGATAFATQTAGTIPTRDAAGNMIASGVAKRVAVTGAIGGLAIAAAGGDENAVRDGFVRAGSMVLIQEGYRSYTQHELSEADKPGKDSILKGSKGPAYCVSSTIECRNPPEGAAKYKDGKFIGWDQSKLDPTAPHTGTAFPLDPNAAPTRFEWPSLSEGAPLLKGFSKIPGVNAMAVFHDQWAVNWNMPPGVLQATIYPAIVITYNGTSAPLFEQIRKVSMKDARNAVVQGTKEGYIEPVIVQDETEKTPVKASQIETSYVCANGLTSRSIAVEVDPKRSGFACRVIYRSNLERKIPWIARNEQDYCFAKARQLAKRQATWGYACMVATAAPKQTQ